ncbi:hypothetical protein [Bradyrhizobium sp. USDA 4474]
MAIPATSLAAAPGDDSALLRLEEEVFKHWHAANAHNDEIARLSESRSDVHRRLIEEASAAGRDLDERERWLQYYATPEGQELDRLVTLSDQNWSAMFGLVEKMWDIPAHAEAGRKAKAWVLIACVMDWRDRDEEMDWRPLMARQLLIDLVGGDAAASMRDQFA